MQAASLLSATLMRLAVEEWAGSGGHPKMIGSQPEILSTFVLLSQME